MFIYLFLFNYFIVVISSVASASDSLSHLIAHLQRLSDGSAQDFDLKELKVGTYVERCELIILDG